MKLSLYCIFLWAAFLPMGGEAAPFLKDKGESIKEKGEGTLIKEKGEGIKEKLDCAQADAYVTEHRDIWQSIWQDLEVDPLLAEAVIYPELIRYSYWQDEMEKTAVSNSYVTLGNLGADFSIGHFQMKISWVERLEKRWMKSQLCRTMEIYFDGKDSRFARKARLARVMDESFWQPVYVGIFLRMLYTDYPELKDLPMTEQVRLCATAYNNGADLPGPSLGDIDRLYRWSTLSSFHTDLVATPLTQMYCYSELSLMHYNYVSKGFKD